MDPSEPTITQPTAPVMPVEVEPQVAATPEAQTPATPEPAVTPVVAAPGTSELSTVSAPAQNAFVQMLIENKKFVAIGVIAVVAVVIGLSVLIGAKSSGEYQGLIKRIDAETQELNKAIQNNVLAPAQSISTDYSLSPSEDIIPMLDEESESAPESESDKISR